MSCKCQVSLLKFCAQDNILDTQTKLQSWGNAELNSKQEASHPLSLPLAFQSPSGAPSGRS